MLNMDLSNKRAFIAGVADDQGFGWAIAKSLAQAGASVCLGVWPPMLSLFERSLRSGRLDVALADGGKLAIEKIYPLDAAFDHPADVPEEVRTHRAYRNLPSFTIHETAAALKRDFGEKPLDVLIHSLANGPEVKKPLLATSRKGYLAAVGASAYSLVGMVQHFGPLMNEGGAVLSLSYLAAQRVIPGYGGGMNSAKAALESDTRVLAFEAGRKYGLRVNAVSPGPLASRAARAIGAIEKMIQYYQKNSMLPKVVTAEQVGQTAAFLVSPAASGITGVTLYVDHGFHGMGMEANLFENA
jgi:enoyl-[acyl-carrier protein] reductase I